MVGGGKDALAETEGDGNAAMSGPPATIDASLERFRELFADYAKKNPGKLNFSSSGSGSSPLFR